MSVHPIRRAGRALVTAMAVVLVAACHDGTAPAAPPATMFDPQQALAKVQPVAAIFDQPIFASFEGTESVFESFFRSAPVTSLTIAPSSGITGMGPRLTRTLLAAAPLLTGAVPDSLRGKTFVYDPTSRSYVIDPLATPVFPTGVRFVLYTLGQGTGPSLPLTRVGSVDIVPPDGSDGSNDFVSIVVIRDVPRAVVADFAVRHSTAGGVNVFGIEGSATDALTVVEVALDGTESGAVGQHHLVYNTTLTAMQYGLTTHELLVSDQATASQTGALDLQYDGHTLRDDPTLTGTEITFDGALYAKVVFPRTVDDQTQYLRPDGTPLGTQQVADLSTLLERTVVANFFWVSLAWP